MARVAGQLALDTNVLMSLGRKSDSAHEFREVYQERGYSLLISPTVLAELVWPAEFGQADEIGEAQIAIDHFEHWGLETFQLGEAQHRIARQFSSLIRGRGLLPMDQRNDGVILGETALMEIPLLATADAHLLNIE